MDDALEHHVEGAAPDERKVETDILVELARATGKSNEPTVITELVVILDEGGSGTHPVLIAEMENP
jgi:hypothetical protein